jgi:nucleoside-diphosphate-sugar epimerase
MDKKIQIFGEGHDERSHVYIDDVINTFDIILKDKVSGTFCIASEKSYSFIDIAHFIKSYFKKKNIQIEIVNIKNSNKISRRYFRNLNIFSKNINLQENKDKLEKNIFIDI